jgi:beta-fructofuranosidase
MFSATGESILGPFDIENATKFPHPSIYAARLVQHNGEWFMLGFRDHENGEFVGELTDPIPVTSLPGIGLVPRT